MDAVNDQPNDKKDDEINDKEMPLLEHLAELRRRLMWSAAALVVAFGICYYFAPQIYNFLAAPLAHALEARGEKPQLIYTALYEVFFTYIQVALFAGLFLAFPVIATQLWLFIAPGLYKKEKRAMVPFLVVTPILFFLGGALAYYVVLPTIYKFLLGFQTAATRGTGVDIQLMAKVSEYLSTVMKIIFAFGVSFELPVLLTLLGRVGILSSAGLKKYRRYAYVGCFIVAAILAPPDALTMCILAGPLLLLYEISVISVGMVEPKVAEDA
jgi:sec-independent protein translocase protein TatC